MNGRPCVVLLRVLGAIVLASAPRLTWSASISKEREVKAAFLYNFTKFIAWPSARFASPNSPIVIGLVGRDPFAGELASLVNGRQVDGRNLDVRVVRSTADCSAVHLLFVPEGEDDLLGTNLATLDSQAVVSVGESDAFRAHGGMMRFLVQSGKVRFAIYRVPPADTGVRISPQLLMLAAHERD